MNTTFFNKIYSEIASRWNLVAYDDIDFLTDIQIESLKKETFYRWSVSTLWTTKYIDNMLKILKYQDITNAPEKIIYKSLLHLCWIVVRNSNSEQYRDFILLWTISFKYYISEHRDSINETIEDDKYLNKTFVENEYDNKEDRHKKDWGLIWYNLAMAFCSIQWIEYPDKWIPDIDFNYTKVTQEFFDLIWYENFQEFYSISPNYYPLRFCILYPVYKHNAKLLWDEQLECVLNPYQFSIENHPVKNLELDDIEQSVVSSYNLYRRFSKNSEIYYQVLCESTIINIIKQSKNNDAILERINKFRKRYKFLKNHIIHWNSIEGLKEWEDEFLSNQYLYMDLQRSIFTLKSILEKNTLKDYRDVFYFLEDVKQKSLWYEKIEESDESLGKWKIIFEISRLFLYQKIGLKQFDWMHSVYEFTKINDPLLKNLYNLILWKFSLAYNKIWVSYFTQWYHMLLKTIFRNCRLQNLTQWMDSFVLPREASNDLWLYEGEDDQDIASLIFDNEWLLLEFKASILLDWKKYIIEKKIPLKPKKVLLEMKKSSFLKPLVSILNSKNGWQIVLWIRENQKVQEELMKWTFSLSDLDSIKLNKFSRCNWHYLTWIDLDLEYLNTDYDKFSQLIDCTIKEYIYPDPFLTDNPINIYFKKFLWKDICVMHITPWKQEYYLKNGDDYKLYIRKNASDQELKSAKDIVEFYKSKNA